MSFSIMTFDSVFFENNSFSKIRLIEERKLDRLLSDHKQSNV
jgi:hypothetical protein